MKIFPFCFYASCYFRYIIFNMMHLKLQNNVSNVWARVLMYFLIQYLFLARHLVLSSTGTVSVVSELPLKVSDI